MVTTPRARYNPSMDPWSAWLNRLEVVDPRDAIECTALAEGAVGLSPTTAPQIDSLLHGLHQFVCRSDSSVQPHSERLVAAVVAAVMQVLARPAESPRVAIAGRLSIEPIVRLYEALGPDSRLRYLLARLLAQQDRDAALAAFAELMVHDPPGHRLDAAAAFSPLFAEDRRQAAALFPRLLDALAQVSVAAAVLDLANHLVRRSLVDVHPAAGRGDELVTLLGSLVDRLERIEEGSAIAPPAAGGSTIEVQRQIAASLGLMTALAEALVLIGNRDAVGKLYRAVELSHRPLRLEVAYALARLGEAKGLQVLVELAAEPVVRSPALAYLDELGERQRVDQAFRSPVALAEGDLVGWLAQPTQFGVAPQAVELFESRRMPWPGYDEPVECFLFQYTYRWGERELRGVGIAGPTVHALVVDLADLPPSDIFAAYAGWSAEHEQIREIEPSAADWRFVDSARRLLDDEGYADVQAEFVGEFFEFCCLVASAARQDQPGTAIVEEGPDEAEGRFRQVHWFPRGNTQRPLGPTEAYFIYKGRKFQRAFGSV